jgi:hypothetical protein
MNLIRVGIGFGALAAGYLLKKGYDTKILDIEIISVSQKGNVITCTYKDSFSKMHAAYQHGNQWYNNTTDELLYDQMSDRLTAACLAFIKTRQEVHTPFLLTNKE